MSDLRVPDLNNVILAGRLTREPELEYTATGTPVCKFSVANTRYYRTGDGEKKEDTSFCDVTVWKKVAEMVKDSIGKGRPVIVEGRLKMDEWEDKNTGARRTKLYIVAHRVTPLDWGDSTPGTQSNVQQEPTEESPF